MDVQHFGDLFDSALALYAEAQETFVENKQEQELIAAFNFLNTWQRNKLITVARAWARLAPHSIASSRVVSGGQAPDRL